jgi:hypothetical protein
MHDPGASVPGASGEDRTERGRLAVTLAEREEHGEGMGGMITVQTAKQKNQAMYDTWLKSFGSGEL